MHSQERARIADERSAAETRFNTREQECRKRFIVTACLDEAKAERRETIDRLRARQLVVDEARRRQRAEERLAELADKADEDARRDGARAAHAASASQAGQPFESHRPGTARAAAARASGPSGRAPSPATGIGITPKAREPMAVREQRESVSRAAFEARKTEATEHRDETIERTTKRMAQKSPGRSLPVPGASSSGASRP